MSEDTSSLPLLDGLIGAGVAGGAGGEDEADTAIARTHHWPVNSSGMTGGWPSICLRSFIFTISCRGPVDQFYPF